jgi:hypothetical protein
MSHFLTDMLSPYAQCVVMLSAIMLRVIKLSVIMLSGIMLSVIMLSAIVSQVTSAKTLLKCYNAIVICNNQPGIYTLIDLY